MRTWAKGSQDGRGPKCFKLWGRATKREKKNFCQIAAWEEQSGRDNLFKGAGKEKGDRGIKKLEKKREFIVRSRASTGRETQRENREFTPSC